MRILHIYRPRLPGLRAQAIQVLHTCHALAERGHEVTLFADRGDRGDHSDGDPRAILADFDLLPLETLHLHVAPTAHPGVAGAWFRARTALWWPGAPGVVYARDKRRTNEIFSYLPDRHELVLESHELDSALAVERGEDPAPLSALERGLVRRARALVTNCGGTLEMWEETHGDLLPAVRRAIHNATAPSRHRSGEGGQTVRLLGSLRDYKGIETLLASGVPIELIGGTSHERDRPVPDHVALLPAVPYPDVPDLLGSAAVLVLPLADNLFGRRLTSPLKLWDYLATDRPIVAPDLPTIREISTLTGTRFHLHRPGDPTDLARAVGEARRAGPRAPFLRTWAQRAAEIESVLEAALA